MSALSEVWWQLLQALEVLCLSIIIVVSKLGNVEAIMSLGRGSLCRRAWRRAWQICGQYHCRFKNVYKCKNFQSHP